MNPQRLYESHRENALAKQIAATEYSTFVAMPFRDSFSYHPQHIYQQVIQRAAAVANEQNIAAKKFAAPQWVKDAPGPAIAITEEILIRILEDHLFLADLTFQNSGVILEIGLAFGLKPNRQIILMSQGEDSELHFDLKINHVIFYRDDSVVEKIARALIAAAAAFEEDVNRYVESVVKALSGPAIKCLRFRAREMGKNPSQSLHEGIATRIFPEHSATEAVVLFQLATQELIQRQLLYTYFGIEPQNLREIHGMFPTELGCAVIRKWWPAGRRSRNR